MFTIIGTEQGSRKPHIWTFVVDNEYALDIWVNALVEAQKPAVDN